MSVCLRVCVFVCGVSRVGNPGVCVYVLQCAVLCVCVCVTMCYNMCHNVVCLCVSFKSCALAAQRNPGVGVFVCLCYNVLCVCEFQELFKSCSEKPWCLIRSVIAASPQTRTITAQFAPCAHISTFTLCAQI